MLIVHNVGSSISKFHIAVFLAGTLAVSYFYVNLWSMKHSSTTAISVALHNVAYAISSSDTSSSSNCPSPPEVNLSWYAPTATVINDLSSVVNGTGVYGYIFNSSLTPVNVPYSTYNWCNMPHVRAQEYIVPDVDLELKYVEVIHRHHKRTPYKSNTFPQEAYPWLCDDESLFYYGAPEPEGKAAQIAWSITQSSLNPFQPTGFPNSTCQFPQITAEGLYDSRQHGSDLFAVYHDKLNFLPSTFDPSKLKFRVTNNVITSQVAGQVAIGMYPSMTLQTLSVTVQPINIDSLEPQYPCPAATTLYSSYSIGSTNPTWLAHLQAPSTISLFSTLDTTSGINPNTPDWHTWFDHYFDNLSSKLCHAKPLPCTPTTPQQCLSTATANAVFRRGLYEYSYIYRDNPSSLPASVASYGVYAAELAHNIRAAITGSSPVLYRHNIAHDGSLARLLSILQVDVMVWPGMGSELVFEVWRAKSSACWYLRVLWKGEVLRSSNPSLGVLDMVPVDALLDYIDGLVGVDAVKVPALCAGA